MGVGAGLPGDSANEGSFPSLLAGWKKLSALLLRKLLVLKESDRFSFWSCNATTEQTLLPLSLQTMLGVRSAPRWPPVPAAPRSSHPACAGGDRGSGGIWRPRARPQAKPDHSTTLLVAFASTPAPPTPFLLGVLPVCCPDGPPHWGFDTICLMNLNHWKYKV